MTSNSIRHNSITQKHFAKSFLQTKDAQEKIKQFSILAGDN